MMLGLNKFAAYSGMSILRSSTASCEQESC